MSLKLAFKAFMKAWREPEKAQGFLEEKVALPPAAVGADTSHLRLLALLQQSGRLVDFLQEDISSYEDAQVGAAVRKIHDDCRQVLEECVTLRPVFTEEEGSKIKVPQGYDANSIKVVGKIKGEPPFEGVLTHKGWKAHKKSLPKKMGTMESEVIYPAEIEVR